MAVMISSLARVGTVAPMDVARMDGRLVLVTGAGGIGRETALLCARRGANLAICDIDEAGPPPRRQLSGDAPGR
jgi:hypothetical protein